jgi:hypothetical protein
MPSSVIKNSHYEADSSTLSITFVSEITYIYKAVPVEIADMLKVAGSKGRYFNHFIKGKFKYRRLRKTK